MTELDKNINSISEHLIKFTSTSKKESQGLWVPTWINVLKVIGTILSILIIELILKLLDISLLNNLVDGLFNFIQLQDSDLLINVHTGIWAVVIGMVFFVSQSLADENEPNKGRVLLKESQIFPILIFELIASILFLVKGFMITKLFLTILISAVTTYSIYSIIKVLVSDYQMEKQKTELLLEVIKKHYRKLIEQVYCTRVANNILLKLSHEINILEVGNPYENNNSIKVMSNKTGLVTDISIQKLKKFVKRIGKVSLVNNGVVVSGAEPEDIDDHGPQSTQATQVKCYFLIELNQEISPETSLFNIIASEESILLIEKEMIQIKKEANSIFKVSKSENTKESAKYEISKIKDLCLTSIQNEAYGSVNENLNLYIELVGILYEYFKEIKFKYAGKDAEKEIGNLFDPLLHISWLVDDVRDLIKASLNSKNKDISRAFIGFPMKIVRFALRNRDLLLFKQFFELHLQTYYQYLNVNSKSRFSFQLIWRPIFETANYYVEPLIDDVDVNIEADDYKDYVATILLNLNKMMKASVDFAEVKDFEVLVNKTSKTFTTYDRRYYRDSNRSNVFDEIQKSKQELFFGLCSWILLKLSEGGKKSILKRYRKLFLIAVPKIPNDFVELSNLFLRCRKEAFERSWGWDDWHLFELEEGTAGFISSSYMLSLLYVYKALTTNHSSFDEGYKLKLNEDNKHYIEENSDVQRILKNILKGDIPTPLQKIKKIESKAQNLLKNLESLVLKQKEHELEILRKTVVPVEVIKKFCEEVSVEYKENTDLRNILSELGLVKDDSQEMKRDNVNNFGVLTYINKAVMAPNVMKHSKGLNFGRNLANSESKELEKLIIENCESVNLDVLTKNESSLFNKNTFILVNNRAIWEVLNKLPEYEKRENSDNNMVGVLKKEEISIPIYECLWGYESSIVILDSTQFGKLIQLMPKPLQGADTQSIRIENLLFNIIDFTNDRKFEDRSINTSSEYLSSKGTEEEQRKFLRERLYISIMERYHLKISKNFKGFYISDKD